MLKYITGRLLLFIPMLIIISLLAFVFSAYAPGDPVERLLSSPEGSGAVRSNSTSLAGEKKMWRTKLGLDLPLFYFSIDRLSMPDTIYRVESHDVRYALSRLVDECGNWKAVSEYHLSLKQLQGELYDLSERNNGSHRGAESGMIGDAIRLTTVLNGSWRPEKIQDQLTKLVEVCTKNGLFKEILPALKRLIQKHKGLLSGTCCWKNFIPVLRWHGNNRYHRWLFGDGNPLTGAGAEFSHGIIRGDFGISLQTKQAVSKRISERIFWSVLLAVLSVLIAYAVSVPLGMRAARKAGSAFDRTSAVLLFVLYSLPVFWVAVLLLMLLANPEIFPSGHALLPASGVKPLTGYPAGAAWMEKVRMSLPYLVLPTICYTYGSLAFLARMVRVSMLEILSLDFIRTARAKGLSERKVLAKHAFSNALLPLITVFANIFPMSIGGAVIIESIFTIPGMGNGLLQAVYNQDYPMLVAFFLLTGILTMAGLLLADILYAVADPRISYNKPASG